MTDKEHGPKNVLDISRIQLKADGKPNATISVCGTEIRFNMAEVMSPKAQLDAARMLALHEMAALERGVKPRSKFADAAADAVINDALKRRLEKAND